MPANISIRTKATQNIQKTTDSSKGNERFLAYIKLLLYSLRSLLRLLLKVFLVQATVQRKLYSRVWVNTLMLYSSPHTVFRCVVRCAIIYVLWAELILYAANTYYMHIQSSSSSSLYIQSTLEINRVFYVQMVQTRHENRLYSFFYYIALSTRSAWWQTNDERQLPACLPACTTKYKITHGKIHKGPAYTPSSISSL